MAKMKVFLCVVTGLQQLSLGSTKSCKIIDKVVKLRENYAFSGQVVRVVTTEIRYQKCPADLPNCCGLNGCCDSRNWQFILVVVVGAWASLLFLAFASVCLYSVFCNRKKHRGEETIKAQPRFVTPKQSMTTYMTLAGFDPETVMAKGRRRSAIHPFEHIPDDESTPESSESD